MFPVDSALKSSLENGLLSDHEDLHYLHFDQA